MPIYEYKCSACQHEMESLQKFSDAPLVKCPACGKDALTKLVSAAGFQLKGSGWYQTDFRGGGAKPTGKPDALKGESGKDAASAEGAKAGASAPAEGKSTESKSTTAAPASTPAPAGGTSTAGA
jgi:putative FmdB family regulatory protein